MPTKNFLVVRDSAPDDALRGAVVAIGNFDGVHRGHRAVIGAALDQARALGRPAAALTFEPHPRAFFNPGEPLFRLTDEAAKLRLLASTGLDGAIVLTFDAALAGLSAEEFVEPHPGRALCRERRRDRLQLPLRHAIAPARRISSKPRARSMASPSTWCRGSRTRGARCRPARFATRSLPAGSTRRPSFSAIRGSCRVAVIHGDKRGRELGFPTANLVLDAACGLRHGIYAVRVAAGGRRYDGVASFGRRPMFDTGAVLLEVFLFDFAGDLYGQTIDVAFIDWIREERMFDSAAALIAQMQDDSRIAHDALARAGDKFPPI